MRGIVNRILKVISKNDLTNLKICDIIIIQFEINQTEM